MEEKKEMMMVMMNMKMMRTLHEASSPNTNITIPIITTTTSPSWKLYENPFFTSHHHHHHHSQEENQENPAIIDHKHHQIHKLHLPIPASKIAASFWDLAFITNPAMEPDSGPGRVELIKAELEAERRTRKKMESLHKKAARELSEERRKREALEHVCEELAKEISAYSDEITRMKKDMEEERKMLRTAEVIREERVAMKLSEAKNFLEERLSELGSSSSLSNKNVSDHGGGDRNSKHASLGEKLRFVLGEKALVDRKRSGESENPHIKRGIRGFVEFPKVVRAIGCRSSSSNNSSSSKLECQKAQLKILLRQKGSVRFNGLLAR